MATGILINWWWRFAWWHQAITWTNAGLLWIEPHKSKLQILIKIQCIWIINTLTLKKWLPFCRHFHVHFLQWKYLYSDDCSQGFMWQHVNINNMSTLTHWGLMATEIWVNIGSGNGLLPDGTKPLPEPMLTDHQWSSVTFIVGQFH